MLVAVFAFCYCLSFAYLLWKAVDDRDQDPWKCFDE
jgi:hypothetical protein